MPLTIGLRIASISRLGRGCPFRKASQIGLQSEMVLNPAPSQREDCGSCQGLWCLRGCTLRQAQRTDLCRLAAGVAQQGLNIAQVRSLLQKMRGKGVAQGIYGGGLRDDCAR